MIWVQTGVSQVSFYLLIYNISTKGKYYILLIGRIKCINFRSLRWETLINLRKNNLKRIENLHFSSGLPFFSHGSIITLTLGVKDFYFKTSEIYLITGFSFMLIFMINNCLGMLIALFFIRLIIAYVFSLKSSWIRLLFIIVYIGGVLVLAIYSILRSRNWNFPPSMIFFSLLFLSLDGNNRFSFYSGDSLGVTLRIIIGLLLLLLFSLFLIVKLIK